jgi:hypothetical protein
MKTSVLKMGTATGAILLVSMLVLFTFGCSENEVNPQPEPPVENFDFALLTDTIWRLTGFADNSGEIKIPEPEGNHRYWLRFNADTTFSGKTSVNPFSGNIALDVDRSAIQFSELDITELPDTIDSNLYLERLLTVDSYSVTASELKLYYNVQKDYLLFKPRGEITYPVEVETVDFVLPTDCGWQHQNQKMDSIYVIRSMDELAPFITCSTNEVSIDFEKYSLLYVRTGTTSNIVNTTQILQQISGNEYLLNVDITLGDLTIPEGWATFIQVPKIAEKAAMKLNITRTPPEIKTNEDYYYWYFDNKIYLDVVLPTRKLLTVRGTPEDSLRVRKLLNKKGISIIELERHAYGNINFYGTPPDDVYIFAIRGNPLPDSIDDEGILLEMPFFITKGGNLIYAFSVFTEFYVHLNKPEDIGILEKMAKENGLAIAGNSVFVPLDYCLICTKESKGNTLQMANLFQETGLFAYTSPNFWGAYHYHDGY